MRLTYASAALFLSGCQLAAPDLSEREAALAPLATADDGAPLSAEESLSAAFTVAALAADASSEVVEAPLEAAREPRLFGFLKPEASDEALREESIEPAVLAGTDIEVVNAARLPDPVAIAEVLSAEDADVAAENAQTLASLEPPVMANEEPVQARTGGLFGFLRSKDARGGGRSHSSAPVQAALRAPIEDLETLAETEAAQDAVTPSEVQELAAKPSDQDVSDAPKKPLFGFLKPSNKTSTSGVVSTVALGETLAFGTVGITCEARKSDMGQQVDQFPRQGKPIWRLFDTDPSSITPRTQYITGFADKCARQTTAALVVFGSAELHEVHRYAASRKRASWTLADDTYEAIKAKACGVPRKTPCPEAKRDRLDAGLAFVTVYPTFGAEKGWLELLLNDGDLASQQVR